MNDDQLYISKVLNGNQKAFAILIERHQSLVFSVIYRVLQSHEDAEEAAQDTFVKAYKTLKSFNGKSKFSTWLYRIAFNTAIDYKRKKRIQTMSVDDSESFLQIPDDNLKSQFDGLVAQQRKLFIDRLLNRLPINDAQLITLFYLKEKSVEETAELVGLSRSNVKVKLYRLRQKLQQELKVLLKHEAKELL